MARIFCVNCGKKGFSKCPYCRSIFGDDEGPVGRADFICSHRMKLDETDPTRVKIEWRGWSDQSVYEALADLKEILNTVNDDELKVLACAHVWDFEPFQQSSIGCGHGSWKSPYDLLMCALERITDGRDISAEFEILVAASRRIQEGGDVQQQ